MNYDDFLAFAWNVASYREKQLERIKVHSRQEISALREWTDKVEGSGPLTEQKNVAAPYFGIPIVVDEAVPPGILRCIRDGEIVAEIAVR